MGGRKKKGFQVSFGNCKIFSTLMPLLNPATLKSEDLSITVSEEVQGNRDMLVPQTCAVPSTDNVPLARILKYH